MSAPLLLRHGQHVKPHYQPAPGQKASWAGRSRDEERPDGTVSGIVRRYRRQERASDKPYSMGLVAQATPNTMRYTVPANIGLRGLSLTVVVTAYAMFLPFMAFVAQPLLQFGTTLLVIGLMSILVMTGFLLWITLFSARLELFRPIDEPTIFDRKNRKVYRLFCDAQPGLKGLFKPWPMRACEYEWDLIDVEHNAQIMTTGSTIRREHSLIFIVRRSADDPTVIDSFNIGNSAIMVTDEAVDAAWEHIRRFMEEGGPPIPEGESLPEPKNRKGLGEAIRGYFRFWVEELPFALLAHVLLPLTLTWLFFNWLARATARPIAWPAEVVAAVGPEVAARRSRA